MDLDCLALVGGVQKCNSSLKTALWKCPEAGRGAEEAAFCLEDDPERDFWLLKSLDGGEQRALPR